MELFVLPAAPVEKLKPREQVAKALMRHYADKGMSLEYLSNPRIMNLSVRTLQKYARRFNLRFADYTPLKLRKIIRESDQKADEEHPAPTGQEATQGQE